MLNSSKAIISGLFFILVTFYLQAADIEKIDPPYWFDCFENDTLMLLLYGENLENLQFKSCSRELKFLSLKPGEHGKNARLFLKIRKSGISELVFKSSDTLIKLNYEIKNTIKYNPQEINSSDVMYLLMPDRFADGDTNNNIIPENPDNVDKEHLWGRHGGDLSGVMSKLDYLKELGITSLWMTPIYDNAYQFAYHGYTPSNLFTVDPHFGNIKLYKTLIDTLHKSGISIIQDHIVNHISPSHPIALYPPDSLWLNGNLNNFHNCDYRISNVTASWGKSVNKEYTQSGWFAGYLPDMNMANPEVQKYYIQHALWWIQSMEIDGIRQDTWPYSDQEGMKQWAKALRHEYPDLYLLAEVWVDDPVELAYFFSDSPRLDNFISSATDFPTTASLKSMMMGQKTLNDFMDQLNQDYLFKDPNSLLLFLDNHDLGRFSHEKGMDINTYLNAYTILYSLRGIPMLYYGNEIMLPGGHDPDNRREFPGGFPEHSRSAFSQSGRNTIENTVFSHIKKLNTLRTDYKDLFQVEMVHHIQKDSLYVLERFANNQHFILIYNHGKSDLFLDPELFNYPLHDNYFNFLEQKNNDFFELNMKIPKKQAIILISAKKR